MYLYYSLKNNPSDLYKIAFELFKKPVVDADLD